MASQLTQQHAVVLKVDVVYHDQASIAHQQREQQQALLGAPLLARGMQRRRRQHKPRHCDCEALEQHGWGAVIVEVADREHLAVKQRRRLCKGKGSSCGGHEGGCCGSGTVLQQVTCRCMEIVA
jgi:hypothetical protein